MNTNEEVVKKEPHGLYGPWAGPCLTAPYMAPLEEDHSIANRT